LLEHSRANTKHGVVGAIEGNSVGELAEGAVDGTFVGSDVTGLFDGIADGIMEGDVEGAAVAGAYVGIAFVGDEVGDVVGVPEALHSIEHAFEVEMKLESTKVQRSIRSNPFSKYSETKIEELVGPWKTQRISLKINPVSNVKPLSLTY
jgi:hypothetical protein